MRRKLLDERPAEERSNEAPELSALEAWRPSTRPKKNKSKKDSAVGTVLLPPANDAAPANAGPRTSLGTGLVPLGSGRMDCATLLRRVYLDDVLACPCGGRRRIVADITEPQAIAAILGHLGLTFEAPPVARARDPSDHAA